MNDFGIGVTLYFKMLKFLIIMFIVAIIFNIPLFVLYNAGGTSNSNTGLKYYLTSLSLAYMGESSISCNYESIY